MRNNNVLRELGYALDITAEEMVEIFKKSNYNVDILKINNMFKRDKEEGFFNVNDNIMTLFLDGFIIHKRGENPKKDESAAPVKKDKRLSNNDILKKLKIALNLHSEHISEIMELAGNPVTKLELNAVFRNKENKNFKECNDKYVKKFLEGLKIKNKGQ